MTTPAHEIIEAQRIELQGVLKETLILHKKSGYTKEESISLVEGTCMEIGNMTLFPVYRLWINSWWEKL